MYFIEVEAASAAQAADPLASALAKS